MRASILPFLGVGVLALLFSGRAALGSDIVTVRVWADPDYVAHRATKDGPKNESYVVAQGEYFQGACWDTTINGKSFPEILHFLAPTLVKQRYFPAKDAKSADELLVVHWGTTIAYMNDYEATGQTTPAPASLFHDYNMSASGMEASKMEADAMDQASQAALLAQRVDQVSQKMNTASVAGLLGYTKQLHREEQKVEVTEVERTLRSNLAEDRYFVILEAYDFPSLQQGHGRKLLWTAHMSIRSAGTNFALALPGMGRVAANLYGQNNDDVVTQKFTEEKRAAVEIGPITIIGEGAPKR